MATANIDPNVNATKPITLSTPPPTTGSSLTNTGVTEPSRSALDIPKTLGAAEQVAQSAGGITPTPVTQTPGQTTTSGSSTVTPQIGGVPGAIVPGVMTSTETSTGAKINTTTQAPSDNPAPIDGAKWNGQNWEMPDATPEVSGITTGGDQFLTPDLNKPHGTGDVWDSKTGVWKAKETVQSPGVDLLNKIFDENKMTPEDRKWWMDNYFKDEASINEFLKLTPEERAQEMGNVQGANALTRDAKLRADYAKSTYDRQVADKEAQFKVDNDQMKAKMNADVQNMSMVAGTSGRLRSQQMVQSISTQLDLNNQVYAEMLRSEDSYMQALASEYEYNNKNASNEYNDAMGKIKTALLTKIQGLQATGAMNTRTGLLQARSFIDAAVNNGYNAMTAWNDKLIIGQQRTKALADAFKEQNTYSKELTESLNDGYIHTTNGGIMQGSDGQPMKMTGSSSGTLLSKEPISLADGSKAMIFQNADGTIRTEKISGTEANQFQLPDAMVKTYSDLYSSGKVKADELLKLGLSPEQVLNIIGNASSGGDWEKTVIKYTDPTTGVESDKIVFTNKKGEIKDPDTGEVVAGGTGGYSVPLGATEGGNDFTTLASKYPGVAAFKNNNPSGITWNANFDGMNPGSLADRLQKAGIGFTKGTDRPKAEGGNYVKFDSIEDGLKATKLMWQISSEKGQTIGQRLKSWSVAGYTLPGVKMSAKFNDLTQEQQDEIVMKQLQHESPGLSKELSAAGVFGPEGINWGVANTPGKPTAPEMSASDEKAFSTFDGKNFEQLAKNITGKTKVNNVDIQNAKKEYDTYLTTKTDKLSPEEETMVQALQNYSLDPSKLPGGMSKEGQAAKKRILAAAFKDPNYDMKQYPAKQKMYNDWTSGKNSINNNAIQTVTGHMMDLAPALEALSNGNIPKFNEMWNNVAQGVGAPDPKNAKAIAQAVASEMAKVYKGTASPTEDEIKEWTNIIGTSVSPEQAKGLLKTLSHLMLSKVKANAGTYERTMGEKPQNIFTPEQTAFLKKQGTNVYDAFTSKKGEFTYPDKSKIEFDGKGKYRYTSKDGKAGNWTKEGTGEKATPQQQQDSVTNTINIASAGMGGVKPKSTTKTPVGPVAPKKPAPQLSPELDAELDSIK